MMIEMILVVFFILTPYKNSDLLSSLFQPREAGPLEDLASTYFIILKDTRNSI